MIDFAQSEGMFDHLYQSYASVGLAAEDFVSKNFDQLEGQHNEILLDRVYVEIVRNFVVA